MSIEDQPTQQLRRPVEPPVPAGLNPTRPQPTAPVETPDHGATDVLSLDNLFEGQPAPAAPELTTTPTATPVASTQPIVPAEPLPPAPAERRLADRRVADRRVGDRRTGGVPTGGEPAPSSRQPALGQRLRGDTTAAVRGGVAGIRDWFMTGDNVLIVATALVALTLILVVALI